MKVRIDHDKCQGHGRCYTLAPAVFGEDDEGNGQVLGDGEVAAEHEASAYLAEANCPESAVIIEVGT
ncbi:MAG: ferredoxin [Mycobacteriales bacterium]